MEEAYRIEQQFENYRIEEPIFFNEGVGYSHDQEFSEASYILEEELEDYN